MKKFSTIELTATQLALLLVTPSLAFSAGGGEASISQLIPYWVNFILYLAILFFALRKVIPQSWMARRNAILENVTASARELESAEQAVRAAEERTKNLATEQETAKQEIIRQAELEAAQIIKNATEKAERQKAQAKDLIEGETRSAEATFRAELVERALELARDKFKSGAFAAKESSYRDAALARAKRLVQ